MDTAEYGCVCHQKSFEELKHAAEASNSKTVSELQQHVVFGKRCQNCLCEVENILSILNAQSEENNL